MIILIKLLSDHSSAGLDNSLQHVLLFLRTVVNIIPLPQLFTKKCLCKQWYSDDVLEHTNMQHQVQETKRYISELEESRSRTGQLQKEYQAKESLVKQLRKELEKKVINIIPFT